MGEYRPGNRERFYRNVYKKRLQKAMEKLTPKQFRDMFKQKTDDQPVKVEANKLTTKEALRSMGEYFELDKAKVKFWIRQMELSKKI
jgi:predicted glutamine amidotransferase